MSLAYQLAFFSLQAESDNSEVIQHLISKNKVDSTSFGMVIEDCLSLALSFTRCAFTHCRRLSNQVAHCLSKLAICGPDQLWIEDTPIDISNLLNADVRNIFN